MDRVVPKFVENITCVTSKIHWNSIKNCDLSSEIPRIKVPTLMIQAIPCVVENGKIVVEGVSRQLFADEKIIKAYLGI